MSGEDEQPEQKADSKTTRSTFLEKMTGTTGQITAFLVAVTAMLAAVPPITEGIKTIYCGIRICDASTAAPFERAEVQSENFARVDSNPLQRFVPDGAVNSNKNPNVVNACYTTVLWKAVRNKWDVVPQDDEIERGAALSWMFSDISDELGLSVALTPLSRNVDFDNVTVLPSKLSDWNVERWPDGTATSTCVGPPHPARFPMTKRKFGHRVDFSVVRKVEPGRYVLLLRNGSGVLVASRDISIR